MIKGAIFDLDGTVLDSMFIWDTIGEDYLRSLGEEPQKNLAAVLKTFTLEQAADYFRCNYGIKSLASEIVSGINNMIVEIYRTRVTLKKGVQEFLKELQMSGVKMCVATATDKTVAKETLERLGVSKYFSEIFTCDEIGSNKDSPDIYRRALSHFGTEKNETMVFEDAFFALKTAKADGFKVAAVYDEHEPEQEKIKEISDRYITSFDSFCFNSKMKTSLTIAGSDSSGGAGIQADIKTMTMNGVYAMSAVTALTAQNTTRVRAVFETTPDFLKKQLDAVFEDIFPDSVKIGMVSSSELIEVIADRLKYRNAKNIVVDPVMVATSGASLIKNDALEALTSKLFPLATLVTPNISEAESLSSMKIYSKEDMVKAAKNIGESYGCSVLLKGGHSINDANDVLYENGSITWFNGKRIDNPNTHGTGCTLSSAVAANLAKGLTLVKSVERAKEYLSNALAAGLDLGNGSGPIKHNYSISDIYSFLCCD